MVKKLNFGAGMFEFETNFALSVTLMSQFTEILLSLISSSLKWEK